MNYEEKELEIATLTEQQTKLHKQWEDIRIDVSKKILSKLEELRWKEGLELLDELTVDITSDYYNREQSDREVAVYVKFKSLDETRSYDFGSSFDVRIHKHKIDLNHGCCGSFDKNNIGQLSRLHLMPAIFDHEQELLNIVNEIDMQVYKDMVKVDSEIYKLNDQIRNEKFKDEEDKILAQLKPGMYIACKQKLQHYDYEKHCHITDGYKWTAIRRIEKITNKYICTVDAYSDGFVPTWSQNHNEKKFLILNDIRLKQRFIVDDLTVCKE